MLATGVGIGRDDQENEGDKMQMVLKRFSFWKRHRCRTTSCERRGMPILHYMAVKRGSTGGGGGGCAVGGGNDADADDANADDANAG